MGTSSQANPPNNATPLVPTWLDEPEQAPFEPQTPDDETDQPDHLPPEEIPPQPPQIPEPEMPQRFRSPRRRYSDYLKSGDTEKLAGALGNYVSRGTGGASNAVRRMGSAPAVAVGTLGFLRTASSEGAAEALKSLNLSHLEGQPVDLVLSEVMNVICPPGGPIDEAISRDAFIEATQGLNTLDNLTYDQVKLVFVRFVGRSIFGRILIDIGNKSINLPRSPEDVAFLEDQVQTFIHNVVEKSVEGIDLLGTQQIKTIVESVYRDTFEILESFS